MLVRHRRIRGGPSGLLDAFLNGTPTLRSRCSTQFEIDVGGSGVMGNDGNAVNSWKGAKRVKGVTRAGTLGG